MNGLMDWFGRFGRGETEIQNDVADWLARGAAPINNAINGHPLLRELGGRTQELAEAALPGASDVRSMMDGSRALMQGDYGTAALAGAGMLPGIPGLTGMTKGATGRIEDAIKATFPDIQISVMEGPDRLHLGKIVVPKEQRGQGIGTQVMKQLADYADQSGKRVELTPDSHFGGSKSRLEKFYGRLGYVKNTGKNKDYTVSTTMYRMPRPN